MKKNPTIREFLKMAEDPNSEAFKDNDNYHFYDWFCKDGSLRNKAIALSKKLKRIVNSPKIDQDNMYVFFKNNCPMVGELYDDFRICDYKSDSPIFTITPKSGHKSENGEGSVWGLENDFKEALFEGSWSEIVNWFVPKKKKSSVWDNPPDYGTYEGERGNPEQWKKFFNFAWDKETIEKILEDDSPHGILKISKDASMEEIEKAFKKLIKIHHPDKGGNEEKAKKIIAAYTKLTRKY